MSIKTTPGIDVSVDSVELEINPSTELSVNSDHVICSEEPQEVTATRKEYSIVGDAFYAGLNSQITPPWLEDLIDSSVDLAVDAGLVDYDLLVQDVRSAIDSIDVAKNTFVHEIGFEERVDSIVGYNLTTFNVQLDNKFATIVDLDVVEANAQYALTLRTSDLEAEFNDTINSRITTVEYAYSSADEALANSIDALTSVYQNQEEDLSGIADAVSGLQTYVGLTEDSYPNGTGMLARVGLLEKQNDGIIEYLTGTYDVMVGVEENDDNSANDELVTDALPYVLWVPMEGTGVPTATTRPYMDYAADTPSQEQAPILENTIYIRSDYTDTDVDRYYIYVEGAWTSINAATYQAEKLSLRTAHTADVYVQYSNNASGVKTYLKSYKFIKTAVDETSPFSTDVDGFGWAIVTDTDSQAAYMVALNAQDLADSKRRVFVTQPFPPYDAGDLWIDDTGPVQIVRASKTDVPAEGVFNDNHWVLADEYAKNFVDTIYTPDSAQLHRQLDGKTEVYFYETYNDSTGVVNLSSANNEQEALDLIDNLWNTEALKDAANGDIVYFKDSENAYWYQASTPAWLAVTDTTVYQAVKAASDAQGAADGKVSQFFAWGGDAAPETYEIVISPAEYSMNAYGEYLDSNGDVTTVPGEYVLLVPEQKDTVEADDYVYWFLNGTLYRKGTSGWSNKVAVPTESGNGSFIAEGDVLTVFDPVTGDLTVYSYGGTSWDITGPSGIISKSRFFVDLENAVNGPLGLARAVSNLEFTSSAYTDSKTALVENKFEYNSKLYIEGYYYEAGFGLNSSGISQQTDGLTPETAFDSEFWVNAERFVLKSPSYPEIQAEFKVTASGITLGLEHTEATRNKPAGTHSSAVPYLEGDMVESNGSSYVARRDVPAGVSIGSATYWQLLSSIGYSGKGSDYWFKRSDSLPVDKPYATGADSNGWYTDLSNPNLNGSGDLYTIKGTKAEGSDVWIYDAPVINNKKFVRELTIYAGPTTGTVGIPNGSTYNFSTDTLNIGSNPSGWGTSVPSINAKDQKVFVTTALVSGNETETSVSVNWNAAAVYAHRVDGLSAYEVWLSEGNSGTEADFIEYLNATDGVDGNTWYSGEGDPSGSLGKVGDFYLKSGRYVYEKTGSSTWIFLEDLQGPTGPVSTTPGPQGSRGSALLTYEMVPTTDSPESISSSTLAGYWNSAANNSQKDEIYGDTLVVTNPHETAGWTHIFEFNGSSWSSTVVFTVNGNQVVEGTISADKLEADIILGEDATFTGTVVIGGKSYDSTTSIPPEDVGADPAGSADTAEQNANKYTDGRNGVNIMCARYCGLKGGESKAEVQWSVGGTTDSSSVSVYSEEIDGGYGKGAIRFEKTSAAEGYLVLGKTTSDYNIIHAPRTKILVSARVRFSGSGTVAIQCHLKDSAGTYREKTKSYTGNGSFILMSWLIDMSNADTRSSLLRFDNNSSSTSGYLYFDDIMVEHYTGDETDPAPSSWSMPAQNRDVTQEHVEERIYPNQDNLQISSSNYSAGSTGWGIDSAGNSEFNNTVVRGTIYASDGEFSGTLNSVDGEFSGTLSGVDGEFIGTVYAENIEGDVTDAITKRYTGTIASNDNSETLFTGSVASAKFKRTIEISGLSLKCNMQALSNESSKVELTVTLYIGGVSKASFNFLTILPSGVQYSGDRTVVVPSLFATIDANSTKSFEVRLTKPNSRAGSITQPNSAGVKLFKEGGALS